MQTDKLNGLIALKIVADKRNFRAAADHLGISPSAISQAIKQLETKLGVTLVSRTTRSTGLTEAGETFLAEAGPAIDQILAAMDNVESFGREPSGLLRLNLPRAVYRSFMPPIIESFKKKYPKVAVELFFQDSLSDLAKNNFDAGIRISDILDKDMVAIKLFGPIRYVVAGSPKYFAKNGRPKHPKDLLEHDCFRTRFGSTGIYDKWEFENKGKEFQVQIKGSLIMNDSTFLIESAIKGHGLIYTAEDSITHHLKSGALEIVLEQYISTSDGYYLYYPKVSQVLPKLRAFIDHVKSEYISKNKANQK